MRRVGLLSMGYLVIVRIDGGFILHLEGVQHSDGDSAFMGVYRTIGIIA
jgi:hypothetical protein